MKVNRKVDLKPWNTFGMRVKAACFVEYDSVEEIESLWGHTEDFPRPFFHIGRGSNLLFTKDFPGTVFHADINFIRELSVTSEGAAAAQAHVLVEVGTGVIWDDFCAWCAERELWGPENLSGIPGEAGAAAVQNIGAYGVEAKDIIHTVCCFDTVTGKTAKFAAKECHYGYRNSMFKDSAKGRYVITSVIFSLSRTPRPRLEYGHIRAAIEDAAKNASSATSQTGTPATAITGATTGPESTALTPALVRRVILSIRDSKLPDPAKIGSAGSFFKNPVVPRSDFERVSSIAKVEHGFDYEVPHYDAGSGFVKIPAAWLIEQCGLKGYKMANAAVYEHQPLVLVNLTGEASPDEILALESKVRSAVYRKFTITLDPEVEHI